MVRHRHWNGKSYTLESSHNKKSIANKKQNKFKKWGYNARVIKVGNKYELWVR